MNDFSNEIRDMNISYLMLAQQMIRADRATAIFRLGIDQEMAALIEGLSNQQLLRLAASNTLLVRLRFDDTTILNMLTDHRKDVALTHSHAAILLAGQSPEEGL